MGLGAMPHPILVPLPAEDVSSEYLHDVLLGKILTKTLVWSGCKVVQVHRVTCVLQ